MTLLATLGAPSMPLSMCCRVVLLAAPVAAATGCGSATEPPVTGQIEVTVTTSGPEPDSNGYQVQVDGSERRVLGADDSTVYEQVRPGSHGIELTGVADNCAVTEGAIRSVTVVAGDTADVKFSVTCIPPLPEGSLVVTVRTQTVNAPTPSGYTLTLDGGRTTAVAATQSVTLAHVSAGVHSLKLSGMPPWCIAGSGGFPGSNPVQVRVVAGAVATVTFGVLCLG